MPDRPTRGRKGRIDQLSDELKDVLHRLLRQNVSQREILRQLEPMLEAAGEKPLSAAGLSRYAAKIERIGRRLRESREIADALTAKFGEKPTGELGQHLIEMIRLFTVEVVLRMDEDGSGGEPIDPKAIADLALIVRRLETAGAIATKRDKELREAWREKAAAEAEQAARDAAESSGTLLPEEALRDIRQKVYGIFDD